MFSNSENSVLYERFFGIWFGIERFSPSILFDRIVLFDVFEIVFLHIFDREKMRGVKKECDNSITSWRPHIIQSVEQPWHRRTSTESLRHTPRGKKNELERRDVSTIRRDVTRGTGFILLSIRLKDLTLRPEEQENKEES